MKIAVIPARGGSKRIPRKNIKLFHGKPMIAWSILTAQKSGLFDSIVVSTDDDEIAEVAASFGAVVPFLRPAHLANDHAGTTEVVAHATSWALNSIPNLEAVCCIYATAPFLRDEDIHRGWTALQSGNWAFAFSVTEYVSPIFRSLKLTNENAVEMFFPENFNVRSQDLPSAFHDAAQFYWGRPSSWLERKKVFDRISTPVIIPRWRVQDIDTAEDWTRAELMFGVIQIATVVEK
jgi:N-acylneuraminate cytidylyltransferase